MELRAAGSLRRQSLGNTAKRQRMKKSGAWARLGDAGVASDENAQEQETGDELQQVRYLHSFSSSLSSECVRLKRSCHFSG